MEIVDFKEDIEYVLNIIKSGFDIDGAFFDESYNLIASTELYLNRKGKKVHPPFLKEVMQNRNTLVNNPGHMESCLGCRFKDHCPSTIELLNVVEVGEITIGVLSFTSFAKEGHDKIISDIETYIGLSNNFSGLISYIITHKDSSKNFEYYMAAALSAFELTEDGLIAVDNEGNIRIINNQALDILSSCDLYTKSVNQIFDKNILPTILSGMSVNNIATKINNISVQLSTVPIKLKNNIAGTAIRIWDKKYAKGISSRTVSSKQKPYSLDSIIGSGTHVKQLKESILKIANSPSTVLITGETGTGKGLLAKVIHYESVRRRQPFITVNCTSIPENLIESELFGYEAGAFTGAKKEGKPGKLELANEGTLFLDEIGEMPISMQTKLLSVLQEATFERVGGITPISVNVRIMAATNQNLEELVKSKKFRADLYYRIHVIPILLEPLRNRREDIKEIMGFFLDKYNKKLNKSILDYTKEVRELLECFDWPGNIRQLENTVEYAVNMAEQRHIGVKDLPGDMVKAIRDEGVQCNKRKENEYRLIAETLDKYGWDVKGKNMAAKELGMGLRTLYRKLSQEGE